LKKAKIVLGSIALILTVSLAAGCGSSQSSTQAAQQPAQQSASQDHSAHNMPNHSMPAGDPMPLIADLEKQLADVAAKQKAGQAADAQKSSAQLVQTVEKVAPHIMDDGLKNKIRQSAASLKDAVHAAKVDQANVDAKIKDLQDTLPKVKEDLNSHKH
jgi:hypothetical protein